MSEFKVTRGMLIRALRDQLPAKKGEVYKVIEVTSNLTLDGLSSRIHLDHSAWQEAYLTYVDESTPAAEVSVEGPVAIEEMAEVIELVPEVIVVEEIQLAPVIVLVTKPKSIYGKILSFIKKGDK